MIISVNFRVYLIHKQIISQNVLFFYIFSSPQCIHFHFVTSPFVSVMKSILSLYSHDAARTPISEAIQRGITRPFSILYMKICCDHFISSLFTHEGFFFPYFPLFQHRTAISFFPS